MLEKELLDRLEQILGRLETGLARKAIEQNKKGKRGSNRKALDAAQSESSQLSEQPEYDEELLKTVQFIGSMVTQAEEHLQAATNQSFYSMSQ